LVSRPLIKERSRPTRRERRQTQEEARRKNRGLDELISVTEIMYRMKYQTKQQRRTISVRYTTINSEASNA
jgi:hypothetical protein